MWLYCIVEVDLDSNINSCKIFLKILQIQCSLCKYLNVTENVRWLEALIAWSKIRNPYGEKRFFIYCSSQHMLILSCSYRAERESSYVPAHRAIPTYLSFAATLSPDWWFLKRKPRWSSTITLWANAKVHNEMNNHKAV